MEVNVEESDFDKLVRVAKLLQTGHTDGKDEKTILKEAHLELNGEDVNNINSLKSKLLWSMIKILSEVKNEDAPREEAGEHAKEDVDEDKPLAKTKSRREVSEPCPVCQLARSGVRTMINEVDEVLGLFGREQPITLKNKQWVENVVREGSALGDFQVPLRKDQVLKPNDKTEATDKALEELDQNVLDIFAAATVTAGAVADGEPFAEKLAAVLWLTGRAVWENESKRREVLYGKAGVAAVKGRRSLTDTDTFDATAAYRSTNTSYFSGAYQNPFQTNRPQFPKKKPRLMDNGGSSSSGFGVGVGASGASGGGGSANWFGGGGGFGAGSGGSGWSGGRGGFGGGGGSSGGFGRGSGGRFGGGTGSSAGGSGAGAAAGSFFRGGKGKANYT